MTGARRTRASKDMITVTIDTNIARDFLDSARAEHASARDLMQLDDAKACEVRVVSRIKADVPGGLLRSRLEIMEVWHRPMIPTIGQWDLSDWNDDFFATEEQGKTFDAMLAQIFPGSQKTGRHQPNRLKDIGHLLGHKIAGRDIFVTNEKAFTGRAIELLRSFSVRVMSSADACRAHQAWWQERGKLGRSR